MNYKDLAAKILPLVGGEENISSHTNCMTRLRINVLDQSKVDVSALKLLEGVQGVVAGDQTQIIVGPGNAQRLEDAFKTIAGGSNLEEETKARVKASQQSPFQQALKHIGNIFIPLIPGFVGTGLLAALFNIIKITAQKNPIGFITPELLLNPWFILFASLGGLLVGILHIVVGYNSGKEFGGTPVLGAIAGALIYLPAMNGTLPGVDIPAVPLSLSYFGHEIILKAGLGGVFGVILAALVFATIEKALRKVVPALFDLILIPFITILVGTVITAFIIMPVAAVIMEGITYVLVDLALKQWGIFGGFILAASFLPLVMLGLHHGLTPVHAQLITDVQYTVLLPILAMAGAGQVGCALAILFKTSDTTLKKRITAALPAGLLGVGEPLIYGVSLPLFYPFITACLGAGFGGAVIAFATQTVGDVGAIAIGPSGLVLIPLIANGMWLWYVAGLLAAYVAGFILTFFLGYNEKMLERLK